MRVLVNQNDQKFDVVSFARSWSEGVLYWIVLLVNSLGGKVCIRTTLKSNGRAHLGHKYSHCEGHVKLKVVIVSSVKLKSGFPIRLPKAHGITPHPRDRVKQGHFLFLVILMLFP